jgi:hypothetical protein
MTRNAVVVSPHPIAREASADAAHRLAAAAVEAGAPDGCIQAVEEPTIPLIEALMSDPTTDVILATGGVAVVRAAYRSGNPAIGVGPGNVPALVDHTADLAAAAERLMDSKCFDNSILCTNESCAIVEERCAAQFERELARHGGHVLSADEAALVREKLYPEGRIRVDLAGRDAARLAEECGIRVPPKTRVLVAPFALVVPEEPLAREKLFPLLGLVRVPDARRGIDAACAMLRIGGAGHSAVIHSRDPRTIMAYGAAVRVLRVAVNVGGSTGSAGLDTNLAPTMTIGTGFFGRSSLGENLEPRHLINMTRVAYSSDPSEVFGDFTGLDARRRPAAGRRGRRGPRRDPPDRARGAAGAGEALMAELRSFIFLDQLQPQTMCYLGTWIRGRLPRTNMAAQIIEIAPGLDIEPLTDVALKSTEVQAGILVVERQFGYLEIHSRSTAEVHAASSAVLQALGATAADATRPQILASELITRLDHQHAFLINRNKLGSMALPGESLFVLEMQPASYAILATNEAEKAARVKVVDYRMIGATGRVYLAGMEADVRTAGDAAVAALGGAV